MKKYETTSVAEIGHYEGIFYDEMALMPNGELEETKVVAYKYKYIESLLDDSQYIMLTYQYDSDYEAEKKRLSLIQGELGSVMYDETKFDLPAYIYTYKEGDNSEFALVNDDKKQITYLYIQCPFDFEEESYVP